MPCPPTSTPGSLASLVLLAALCASPHVALRGFRPSLYSDDVARVEMLRTHPPHQLLGRPFNEHLAPGFDLVSIAAWRAAGGNLVAARWTFTLAALLLAVLAAAALAAVVRRETGWSGPDRVALALFCVASLDLETFWWYSASSFMGSLINCLLVWWGVARGGPLGCATAGLAAAAAPAFSGIGLLAGPLGALRAFTGREESHRGRRAAFSLLGTAVYLAALAGTGHPQRVATSARRNLNIVAGLTSVARAPWVKLIPGLAGADAAILERWLPTGLAIVLSLGVGGVILVASRRSPRRGALLMALAMIVGGYMLAYLARADLSGGAESMRRVQRYHLFPRAGFVIFLAVGLEPLGRRLESTRLPLRRLAPLLAVVLLFLHQGRMRDLARFYSFSGQRDMLAALDRLDSTCRRQGITRKQALEALAPVHTLWTPVPGLNPLRMLGPCARRAQVPDGAVPAVLLAGMHPADRLALCGGMEATAYLTALPTASGVRPTLASARAGPVGTAAYLELTPGDEITALPLPAGSAGRAVELWWADGAERWSPSRSVWIGPSVSDSFAVAVARLPHWTPPLRRRVRWVIREEVLAQAPASRRSR